MEFRLPSQEETQIRIVIDKEKPPLVMDLLELDDLHVDAAKLSDKMKTSFDSCFSSLFQEKYGIPLTRTQIWLLLNYKRNQLNELKKNCSDSPSFVSSMESQEESTDD